MALLPIRHPQKDFFILDIADAVPKDDTASMEHPLFSLATKPDMRHLEYRNGDSILKITPSGVGLPTIFDKDILIFAISQLIAKKNRGEEIGKRIRFSAREMMVATNRRTGGKEYQRLEAAFDRLRGTSFKTNIKAGGKVETRVFGMIEEGGFVRDEDSFRVDYCEIVLSDWLMKAVNGNDIVTISEKYFRLRRPLERRLYEIARKFCGKQPKWHIGLAKLQERTGSNAPIKRFRHNLREIITEDNTPYYRFEITDNDLVIVRPRKSMIDLAPDIKIPEWADEQAREIAIKLGWDYHVFRGDWVRFAKEETLKGNPPKNAGAAFVSWAKKQTNVR